MRMAGSFAFLLALPCGFLLGVFIGIPFALANLVKRRLVKLWTHNFP